MKVRQKFGPPKNTILSRLLKIFYSKFDATISESFCVFCGNFKFLTFNLSENKSSRRFMADSSRTSITWSKIITFCSIPLAPKFNSYRDIMSLAIPYKSVERSFLLRACFISLKISRADTFPFKFQSR